MLYLVYKCFSRNMLTRDFVRRIENRMTILYPGPRNYFVKKTALTLVRVMIFSLISVVGMMMFADMSFYYVCITIAMTYVICTSIVYNRLDKIETKLLSSLEQFITDVRYRYRFDKMIEDALEDAINTADYEMSLHGQLILDILRENQKKSYDNPYREYSPNHFFMTLYVICETVMIYGDKYVDGRSMFLKNIGYLKEDIHGEIIRRNQIRNEFMGLTGITVLPVFAIKPIEMWATYNMPELSNEYSTIKGIIITIALVLFSMITFMIIKRLRYDSEIDNHKGTWVQTLLNIPWIESVMIKIVSLNYSKYFKIDRKLKSIVYKYNVKELLLVRMVYSTFAAVLSMMIMLTIGVGILSLPAGIIVGILVYMGIYVSILFRQQIMLIGREEEVIRFQTIILVLMHMDRITVEKLLENMESFAVVFKDSIEKIADHLAYKGNKIFYEAKDEASFIPYERLIDAFIASDRIGICSAFEDVEADRTYYVEKHKLENQEIVKNKALIAKFIAFIPLCSVIIFKLVLPFIIYGMQQLGSFSMTI